jgi:DNA-binding NarL/FixJ family response regulator
MGVAALLSVQADLEVVGEAGRAADVLPRVRATRPEVVLLGELPHEHPEGTGDAAARPASPTTSRSACTDSSAATPMRSSSRPSTKKTLVGVGESTPRSMILTLTRAASAHPRSRSTR